MAKVSTKLYWLQLKTSLRRLPTNVSLIFTFLLAALAVAALLAAKPSLDTVERSGEQPEVRASRGVRVNFGELSEAGKRIDAWADFQPGSPPSRDPFKPVLP